MQKLLIVDGSNLLFQMFYGMPARIVGKSGRPVHGTIGFVGALMKIIRMVRPTHAVVLFDGEHENPRAALDPAYKANRVDYSQMPEDETPFSQLADIYLALDFMGIKHTETTDCETDDIVAAYVFSRTNDSEIVISSFDSDYFQLISTNVSVLRYRGKSSVLCGEEYILEKFGIGADKYADMKALCGDASDNIRGVPRVGQKTAARLINEFGSLDGIMQNADRIKQPALRESILMNLDRLLLNRQLITLSGGAALPFETEELEFIMPEFTSVQALKALGII